MIKKTGKKPNFKIYRQTSVKNHLVKTLQVIIPFIFFTLFAYVTYINPG